LAGMGEDWGPAGKTTFHDYTQLMAFENWPIKIQLLLGKTLGDTNIFACMWTCQSNIKQCRKLLRTIIAHSVNVVLNSNSAILVKLCIFHRKTCSNRHKENNLSEFSSHIYVIKLAYRSKTLNIIQPKFPTHAQEKF
jgi:hypothetical protein